MVQKTQGWEGNKPPILGICCELSETEIKCDYVIVSQTIADHTTLDAVLIEMKPDADPQNALWDDVELTDIKLDWIGLEATKYNYRYEDVTLDLYQGE